MRFTSSLSVKFYIYVFLIILALASVFMLQKLDLILQLVFATLAAALIDLSINFIKLRKLVLPSSAVISGLFIGIILPASSLIVLASAALLAIISKHAIRFHKRHIFNPAAFGIVISSAVFGIVPIWWVSATLLVIPLGLFIVYKIKKWLLAFSFIASYYIIAAVQNVSNISAISYLTLAFFAFFMLIEPLTSAYTKKAMAVQGLLVSILVIVFSNFIYGADIFLLPLLASNIFVPLLNKKLQPRAKSIQEAPTAPPIAAA